MFMRTRQGKGLKAVTNKRTRLQTLTCEFALNSKVFFFGSHNGLKAIGIKVGMQSTK